MSWQTSKELKEKRAKIWEEAKEFNDSVVAEERDMNAEEEERWGAYQEDLSKIDVQLEELEAAQKKAQERSKILSDIGENLQKRSGYDDLRPDPQGQRDKPAVITHEHRDLAIQGWMLRQSNREIENRHQEAANLCGIDINQKEIGIDLRTGFFTGREMRGLTVGTTTEGGFTVPEGFVNNLEQSLLAFGGVRNVATILRTSVGNDLPWPTVNDTGNTGELLGEAASIGSSVDPTFGRLLLQAYKYSSKLVLVSHEIMTDSAFNLAQWLGRALGERIGRIQSTHFTTGDGSSKPNGIVTVAGVGKTATATTAITFDEVIDLIQSVDPSYRPMARFMMHDNVLAAIRKLKDDNNQYLWQPNNQDGEASRLLGYPYTINQQMSSTITASDKTILFGDTSKYIVRDVAQIRLRRLVERYADTDQEGFVAFLRSDGDLLDAGTDPVKVLQQAAS